MLSLSSLSSSTPNSHPPFLFCFPFLILFCPLFLFLLFYCFCTFSLHPLHPLHPFLASPHLLSSLSPSYPLILSPSHPLTLFLPPPSSLHSITISSCSKELYAGYSNQQVVAWVKPKHNANPNQEDGDLDMENYYFFHKIRL